MPVPIPVVLVTGVDPGAMAATTVGVQFDLPFAVTVRHHIDVGRQVLERVVSDVTGLLEHEEIPLEHACVSCALREDVLPTLHRLAGDGRWRAVVAHLPVAAEPRQVCDAVAADRRLAARLRVASVVCALDGGAVVTDLLGDDLLAERDLHTSPGDRRGVGETAAALVEYADVVVLADRATVPGAALVRAMVRPGAHVVEGSEHLDPALLLGDTHDHAAAVAWTAPVRRGPLPPAPGLADAGVWRADLRSVHPFHPTRLVERIEGLGGGASRSRGCFWLPTRPADVLVWDGAGGQLGVGTGPAWGRREPLTRIVLLGVGVEPTHLREAFADVLLRPDDAAPRGGWRGAADGLETWLGPTRDVA